MNNDSVLFSDGETLQSFCLADKDGKRAIAPNYGKEGKIQQYEDTVYMLETINNTDQKNSEYLLKSHNLKTQQTVEIMVLKNVCNFFVFKDNVFLKTYKAQDEGMVFYLKRLDLNSKKTEIICDNVMSFGVIEDKITYLVAENEKIKIGQYFAEKGTKTVLGAIPLKSGTYNSAFDMNYYAFTKDNIIIASNSADNTALIHVYSNQTKLVQTLKRENSIISLAAGEGYSYFMEKSKDGSKSFVYKMNNNAAEALEIGEIEGVAEGVFVGSDEGAYVKTANAINFYAEDKKPQKVYSQEEK